MSGSTERNVYINIQFEVNIRSRNFAHRTVQIIEIKVKYLHSQHTVLKTHAFLWPMFYILHDVPECEIHVWKLVATQLECDYFPLCFCGCRLTYLHF